MKTISNKPYGYLVENSWKKGKVKQKVKKYLGPVVKLDKLNERTFSEWKDVDVAAYVSSTSVRKIMRDIIAYTLAMHGFHGSKYGNITLKRSAPYRNGKDIVLELTDGYFFKIAANQLLNFKKVEEERPGEMLAKAFHQAGIPIEKQLFILLYRKVYNV